MSIYKYLIKVNIAGICPESLFIPGELLQLLLFHLAVQIYNQHFYNNKQYNFIKGCLQKKYYPYKITKHEQNVVKSGRNIVPAGGVKLR